MKKIALILSLVLMLAACGAAPAETTTTPVETTTPAAAAPEGACADLFVSLYEKTPVELMLACETLETALADDEMYTYLTTLTSKDGIVDAAVSMPMMGAQAFHSVMVRAESAEKAAEVAQFMFDNMDMARWVCVQATEKAAVVCGDLAYFVMLDPQYGVTCDQLVEGFTAVCGGAVDSVIK